MCVANVIFGQERLTEQFLSMHFFMTALFSLRNGARLQARTLLSTRSFYESILFVHPMLLSNQYNLDLKPPSFIWRQGIHALQ